jgi:YidC/Oxa1 family membrane protein insertase
MGFSEFNGLQYMVLPVLAVTLQLGQQLMAMPRVQDPQQKMMSQVMMFMPLFLGYIALTFPAGAVLYWVTSSVIGIVQQYFTSGWGSLANYLKFLPADDKRPAATIEASQPTETEPAKVGGAPALAAVGSSGGPVAAARPTFWEVLAPLVEDRDGQRSEATEQATIVEEAGEDEGAEDDAPAPAEPSRRKSTAPVQRHPRARSTKRQRGRRK